MKIYSNPINSSIITLSQKSGGQDVKSLNFFKQIERDIGIKWTEVESFTRINDAGTTNAPIKMYKSINGKMKTNMMKKMDYSVDLSFNCSIHKDEKGRDVLQEHIATIVLKSLSLNKAIASWMISRASYKNNEGVFYEAIRNLLKKDLGMSGKNLEFPVEYSNRVNTNKDMEATTLSNGQEVYYYHRLTRQKTNAYPPSELELYMTKDPFDQYIPVFRVTYFDFSNHEEKKKLAPKSMSASKAIEILDKSMNAAIQQRNYVTSSSPLYIPDGADSDNYDFLLHKWKTPQQEKIDVPQTDNPQEQTEETDENVYGVPGMDLSQLFGQAQDFGGYFQGEVPDFAGNMVGSPTVDASQIGSMFSGTNEAISLVNSYTSDALKNVAYIFNFSKGGAYGVYVPSLDRAIKTKALKKQLEQKGYIIEDQNGLLTAHPSKTEKTPEEIDADINSLWKQLNAGGGSALGINMGDVLRATQENASSILSTIKQQFPEVDPQVESILYDVLSIYHLAAIIVHEASHTKGGDEGQAESDEGSFRNWAQSYLNSQYQSKLSSAGLEEYYSPLEMGTEVLHASDKNWYRTAQSISGRLNYAPSSGALPPRGSDLSGRYQGSWQNEGLAEWAYLLQQDQSIPIEKRLNREHQPHLEPDVDPANDIVEEQLRKQFKNDDKPNPQLIMEELLAPDRDTAPGYKAMETLLDELRPRPLMTPLSTTAMVKEARQNSLFGWYNNLDLDDGSTIPGLSDRVMAWDDRDESFSGTEQEIKEQTRYNPTYDLKGFYFRWIEPRFKPQLFDDMTQDYSNVHPAKRFAGKLDPTVTQMLRIIKLVENDIINGKTKATRIIFSPEMAEIIRRLLDKNGLSIRVYKIRGEDLFSAWVTNGTVNPINIDKAERYFQNEDGGEDYRDLANEILGTRDRACKAVEKLVSEAKELCKSQKTDDLYIVGEYAREIYEGEATPFVNSLHFVSESIDESLKLGNMLSTVLNVSTEYVKTNSMGYSFPYRGIKVFFSKSPYLHGIASEMAKKSINYESSLLRDLCNKDFTINMLMYDVRNMKIIDPLGVKEDIDNKVVKTLFDPEFIFSSNPSLVLRVFQLKAEGYATGKDIEKALIKNCATCNHRYSPELMMFWRELLKSNGTNVEEVFEEYGLNLYKEEEYAVAN